MAMNDNPSPHTPDITPVGPMPSLAARPRFKLAMLGILGVLLVAVLAIVAWFLHLIWWTVPFLQESGLLVWMALAVLSLAVTALLVGMKFSLAWRRSLARITPVYAMLSVSIALVGWLCYRGNLALVEFLPRVLKLNLSNLSSPVPTYYDYGVRNRAERLQTDIRDMNSFFREQLGVQAAVTLAVLNSNQWTRVNPVPFGLPGILGEPPVIFIPAHSGGWAFRQMLARKEAIPIELLQDYLRSRKSTFEAAADDFVDFIALHELGHALLIHYGIDPGCNWLNEFLASYFGYAFIAERRPERKPVIALFGRPSQARPKHTTLEDLERLYFLVDDYGWYQGMFERRIQEMYPQAGLQFIKDIKSLLPRTTNIPDGVSIPDAIVNRIKPEMALKKLEAIAPGFQEWAKGFQQ